MRRLVLGARVQIKTQWPEFFGGAQRKNLKKIKIVEDEKDRQENIDNHSGQNYNVENLCICTHE